MSSEYKHALSLTVNHRPGVLIRIALVFSRRGFNIESLVVSEATDPRFAKMVIVATGEQHVLIQIIRQLAKLVDVIHVAEHDKSNTIQRELALFKIIINHSERSDLLQLIHALHGTILEVGERHVIIELSGSSVHLDNATKLLRQYGIFEIIRSGKLVMRLGPQDT